MNGPYLTRRYADTTGWNESTLLELALQYIANQQDDGAFIEFLDTAAEDEMCGRYCEICGYNIGDYEPRATRCGACTNAYGDPATGEPPLGPDEEER